MDEQPTEAEQGGAGNSAVDNDDIVGHASVGKPAVETVVAPQEEKKEEEQETASPALFVAVCIFKALWVLCCFLLLILPDLTHCLSPYHHPQGALRWAHAGVGALHGNSLSHTGYQALHPIHRHHRVGHVPTGVCRAMHPPLGIRTLF